MGKRAVILTLALEAKKNIRWEGGTDHFHCNEEAAIFDRTSDAIAAWFRGA